MSKFKKKPVIVEAITFSELVQHGIDNGGNIVNGMPWSFQYKGQGITHENDQTYLIPTLEGIMKFTTDDMLITGVNGEIYPCKKDIFEKTYEAVDTCGRQLDHIDRMIIEHNELMAKLVKLNEFIEGDKFKPLESRARLMLSRQAAAMEDYAECLHERLKDFGCIQFTGANWPEMVEKFGGGELVDGDFVTPSGDNFSVGMWVK